MAFNAEPSIIHSPDARPYLGFDPLNTPITGDESAFMRIIFNEVCLELGTQNPVYTASRQVTQQQAPEFIDQAYSEGFVYIGAVNLKETEDDENGFRISLIHHALEPDYADGPRRWHSRRSAYNVDEDGSLIRADVPRYEDRKRLQHAISEAVDTHFPVIELEPRPHTRTMSPEAAQAALLAWEVKNHQVWVAQQAARTKAHTAVLQRQKCYGGPPQDMLKELGLSRQRVRMGEFAQLMGLVTQAYELSEAA